MRCVDCQHMTSGNSKDMARLGFAQCAKKLESSTYQSATWERECGLFEVAPAEQVGIRINWLRGQHGK